MPEPTTLPEDLLVRALAGRGGHGTYEAHVTVEAPDAAARERFRAACGELGVKPVLIELPHGKAPSQPMTSSYVRGDLAEATTQVAAIARRLRADGFPVTRVKLGAVATNDGLPDTDDDARAFPPGCYFEFHVKLALPPGADLAPLRGACDRFGARLSRNAFKQSADGRAERFVTLRVYGAGRRSAFARLDELTTNLTAAGFAVLNRQREYALFDSHAALDAGWLDARPGCPRDCRVECPGRRGEPDRAAGAGGARHHFLEAVLRRMPAGESPASVLRGSMLTRLWAAPFPRPAADLDFLGAFPHSVADTAARFLPPLAADHDDGVRFDVPRCVAKGIWEGTDFPGVRLTLRGDVFGEEQVTTVDVGFGDPLVPPAEVVEYPLMTGESVPVWAVHPATLIGWKLHGLAEWGRLRWRPKDLLDLWLLTRKFDHPAELLAEAVAVAFTSRGYDPADARRTVEDAARWRTFAAGAKWSDFRREHPDAPVPESVAAVAAAVAARLRPALDLLPTRRGPPCR